MVEAVEVDEGFCKCFSDYGDDIPNNDFTGCFHGGSPEGINNSFMIYKTCQLASIVWER